MFNALNCDGIDRQNTLPDFDLPYFGTTHQVTADSKPYQLVESVDEQVRIKQSSPPQDLDPWTEQMWD